LGQAFGLWIQIRPQEGNTDRQIKTNRQRKGTVIGLGLRPIYPNKAAAK
jgi:hypothetical protein